MIEWIVLLQNARQESNVEVFLYVNQNLARRELRYMTFFLIVFVFLYRERVVVFLT